MHDLDIARKSAPKRLGKSALNRNRRLPISTSLSAEVGQARLRRGVPTDGRESGHVSLCPRYSAILALVLLSLCMKTGAASAHALLDHADPRVGNTVKSPHVVSLWFTQNLETAFSTVEVFDSNGARINTGNAAVDKTDRKLLRVPVKALPPGTYTVKWRVLSVDTHTTEGNFTFHVAP